MPDIAWGKSPKITPAFKAKVLTISSNLGCDPSHLMSAMAFETGETFSPNRSHCQSPAGLVLGISMWPSPLQGSNQWAKRASWRAVLMRPAPGPG